MTTSVDARPDLMGAITSRREPRWPVWIAAVYGVAAGLAVLAWWIVGDRWWTAFVNAITFWWALPALPLLAGVLALRWWRAAAFLAVPALTFVWAFGGLYVGSPPDVAPELKVVSYNLYIRAPDLSHVVSLVRDEQPDVLLVQEVLPATADDLRSAVGEELPHAWFGEAGRVGGVGLLSRHPITEVAPLAAVGSSSRPTAVVTLDVFGRAVQVVPVHLTSPCPGCGESLVQRQAFEADARRREVDAVVDALDPDVPTIIGGDFNSTRRSDPYRRLAGIGFRDPQVEAGSGPGFTWPDGSGPFVRIDWVLVRGLVPTAAWVDPPRASDHRPVVVEVGFETDG